MEDKILDYIAIFKMIREKSHLIFITLLLIFHSINNYLILKNSNYLMSPDSLLYYENTIELKKDIFGSKISISQINKTLTTIYDTWKPPLFHIISSPFLLISHDIKVVSMCNILFYVILLFSIYGIGKKLYNKEVGIVSMFGVSMLPGIFAQSRVFFIDFSLVSMVSLTFYLFFN